MRYFQRLRNPLAGYLGPHLREVRNTLAGYLGPQVFKGFPVIGTEGLRLALLWSLVVLRSSLSSEKGLLDISDHKRRHYSNLEKGGTRQKFWWQRWDRQ